MWFVVFSVGLIAEFFAIECFGFCCCDCGFVRFGAWVWVAWFVGVGCIGVCRLDCWLMRLGLFWFALDGCRAVHWRF